MTLQKALKSFSFSTGALPQTPLGVLTTLLLILQAAGEGVCSTHFLPSASQSRRLGSWGTSCPLAPNPGNATAKYIKIECLVDPGNDTTVNSFLILTVSGSIFQPRLLLRNQIRCCTVCQFTLFRCCRGHQVTSVQRLTYAIISHQNRKSWGSQGVHAPLLGYRRTKG